MANNCLVNQSYASGLWFREHNVTACPPSNNSARKHVFISVFHQSGSRRSYEAPTKRDT
jgi:hypothetical protein